MFSEINSEIEDTGWKYESEASPLYYKRKNGVVYVRFHWFNQNNPLTDGQAVGTLPEGYRPPFQILESSYNSKTFLRIDTDGNVSVGTASSDIVSSGYVSMTTSYPVD